MDYKERAISEIGTSKCIALTTFKRDGSRISTPIWFNVMGGKIYVTTETSLGRSKESPTIPMSSSLCAPSEGK